MASVPALSQLAILALRLPSDWRLSTLLDCDLRLELPRGTQVASWPSLDWPIERGETLVLRPSSAVWLDGGSYVLASPSSSSSARLIIVGPPAEVSVAPLALSSVQEVRALRLESSDFVKIPTFHNHGQQANWCPPGTIFSINDVNITVPDLTGVLLLPPSPPDVTQIAYQTLRCRHVVLRLVCLLRILRKSLSGFREDAWRRLGHEIDVLGLDVRLLSLRLTARDCSWITDVERFVAISKTVWKRLQGLRDPQEYLLILLRLREVDHSFLEDLNSALDLNTDSEASWQQTRVARAKERIDGFVEGMVKQRKTENVEEKADEVIEGADSGGEVEDLPSVASVIDVRRTLDSRQTKSRHREMEVLREWYRRRFHEICSVLGDASMPRLHLTMTREGLAQRVTEVLSASPKQGKDSGDSDSVDRPFLDFLQARIADSGLSEERSSDAAVQHMILLLAHAVVMISESPTASGALQETFAEVVSRLRLRPDFRIVLPILTILENHVRESRRPRPTPTPSPAPTIGRVKAELERTRHVFDNCRDGDKDMQRQGSSLAALLRRYCSMLAEASNSADDTTGCGACSFPRQEGEMLGVNWEDVILTTRSYSTSHFPTSFVKEVHDITQRRVHSILALGHRIIDAEQTRRWESLDEVESWYAVRNSVCRRLDELIAAHLLWSRRLANNTEPDPIIEAAARLRRRERAHLRQVTAAIPQLHRLRVRLRHELAWWSDFFRRPSPTRCRLTDLASLSDSSASLLSTGLVRRDAFLVLMRRCRRQLSTVCLPVMELRLLDGAAKLGRHLRLLRRRCSALKWSASLLAASQLHPDLLTSKSLEAKLSESGEDSDTQFQSEQTAENLARSVDADLALLWRLQALVDRIQSRLEPLGITLEREELEEAGRRLEAAREFLRHFLRDTISDQVSAVDSDQLPLVVEMLQKKLEEVESLVGDEVAYGGQIDLLRYYTDRVWRRCDGELAQCCRQIRHRLASVCAAATHRADVQTLLNAARDDLQSRVVDLETRMRLLEYGISFSCSWRHIAVDVRRKDLHRHSARLSRWSSHFKRLSTDARSLFDQETNFELNTELQGEIAKVKNLREHARQVNATESAHCRRLTELWSVWRSSKRCIRSAIDELDAWTTGDLLSFGLESSSRSHAISEFSRARNRLQGILDAFLPRLHESSRALARKLDHDSLTYVLRTQSSLSEAAVAIQTAVQVSRDAISELERSVRHFERSLAAAEASLSLAWRQLRSSNPPLSVDADIKAVEAAYMQLTFPQARLDPVSQTIALESLRGLRRHAEALSVFQTLIEKRTTSSEPENAVTETLEAADAAIASLSSPERVLPCCLPSSPLEKVRECMNGDLERLQRLHGEKRAALTTFARHSRSISISRRVETSLNEWMRVTSTLEARVFQHRCLLLSRLPPDELVAWWRQEGSEIVASICGEEQETRSPEDMDRWKSIHLQAKWLHHLSRHILREFIRVEGHCPEHQRLEAVLGLTSVSLQLVRDVESGKAAAEETNMRCGNLLHRCRDLRVSLTNIRDTLEEITARPHQRMSLLKVDLDHQTWLALRAAYQDAVDQFTICLAQLTAISGHTNVNEFRTHEEELQELEKCLGECRYALSDARETVGTKYELWRRRLNAMRKIESVISTTEGGDDIRDIAQELRNLKEDLAKEENRCRDDDFCALEVVLDSMTSQLEWICKLDLRDAQLKIGRYLLRSLVFLLRRFRFFETEFSYRGGVEFEEEAHTILRLSREVMQQVLAEESVLKPSTVVAVKAMTSSIETRLCAQLQIRNALDQQRKSACQMFIGLVNMLTVNVNKAKFMRLDSVESSNSPNPVSPIREDFDVVLRNTKLMMQDILAVNWTVQCLEFRCNSVSQFRAIQPILMYRLWNAVHDIAICAHNGFVQSQGLNDRVRNFDVWLFSLELKTKPNPSRNPKTIQFWEDVLFQLNSKRKEIYDLKTQYQSQSQLGRTESPNPLKSKIDKVINSFQRLESAASKAVLSMSSPTQKSVFNFDMNPSLTQPTSTMSSLPSTPTTRCTTSTGSQSKMGSGRYWSLSQSPQSAEPVTFGFQSRLPVNVNRSTSNLSATSSRSQNSVFGSDDSLNKPTLSRNKSKESLRVKGSRDSLLPTFQGHSRPEKKVPPERTNGAATAGAPSARDLKPSETKTVSDTEPSNTEKHEEREGEDSVFAKSATNLRIPTGEMAKTISGSRSCSDLYSATSQHSHIPVLQKNTPMTRSQSLTSHLTINLQRARRVLSQSTPHIDSELVPENRSSMTVLVNRKPSRFTGSFSTVTSYHSELGQAKKNENKKLGEIISKLPRLVKNERMRREAEKAATQADSGPPSDSKKPNEGDGEIKRPQQSTDVVDNGEKVEHSRLTKRLGIEQKEEVMIRNPSTQNTRITGDHVAKNRQKKQNKRELFTNNIVSPNPDEFPQIFNEVSSTLIKWDELLNKLLPKAKQHLSTEELRDHCLTLGNILDSLPDQKGQLLALQLGDSSVELKSDDDVVVIESITELSLRWRRVYLKLQEWQNYLQIRFVEDEEMHKQLDILETEVIDIREAVNRHIPNSTDTAMERRNQNESLNKIRFDAYVIESKLDEILNYASALQKEFSSPNRKNPLLEFNEMIFAVRDALALEKNRSNSFIDSNNSTLLISPNSSTMATDSNDARDGRFERYAESQAESSSVPAKISLGDLSKTQSGISTASLTGLRFKAGEIPADECITFSDHTYCDKSHRRSGTSTERPKTQFRCRLKRGLLIMAYTLPVDLFFLVLLAAVLLFMTPSCSESVLCRVLDNRQFLWSKYWLDGPPV